MALAAIRAQKLKSFFSLIGVLIGVTFLIAVVSIVQGMNVYIKDKFANTLVGLNTYNLRQRPDFVAGNVTDEQWHEWQRRPADQLCRRRLCDRAPQDPGDHRQVLPGPGQRFLRCQGGQGHRPDRHPGLVLHDQGIRNHQRAGLQRAGGGDRASPSWSSATSWAKSSSPGWTPSARKCGSGASPTGSSASWPSRARCSACRWTSSSSCRSWPRAGG